MNYTVKDLVEYIELSGRIQIIEYNQLVERLELIHRDLLVDLILNESIRVCKLKDDAQFDVVMNLIGRFNVKIPIENMSDIIKKVQEYSLIIDPFIEVLIKYNDIKNDIAFTINTEEFKIIEEWALIDEDYESLAKIMKVLDKS